MGRQKKKKLNHGNSTEESYYIVLCFFLNNETHFLYVLQTYEVDKNMLNDMYYDLYFRN